MVSHNLIEAEIECLPADLPEYLEVDISELPLNGLVHLSEIKLPEGVVIPALAQGEERITEELLAVAGSPTDVGGYYQPDMQRASEAMRPSATLNAIIDGI